ncbi:MAG TPA: aminotransferase class V-fold PLP-dependent enzyme [Thermomicrobiales bacterium]|jgi:L-seryl-tRNA(Ser) seleniumtransferase|nr:aminotransferase class V-fold PLP-dependent enzyme [Thermomicrobiales bacterium]
MSVYQTLEVAKVINAAATLTRLGGSRMPPPVVEAMSEAAEAFVDLPELQARVGERIAEFTHNEACYISSGAAAGITVAVASIIAGTDPEKINAFPYLDGIDKTELIVHRSQRNGYDYAARQTGARLIEIEGTEEALRAAINDKTAAVLWFAGAHFAADALPLDRVVAIAHENGLPVIVDAAAQIPPISNLWRFTREFGADVAIFSGGKGLRGPQSSGLVLGKREIIEGCRPNGSPNSSITRPMKVGKEELAGILAAVEWSLNQDEEATIGGYETTVQNWIAGLQGIPGVTVERSFPSEAGQPHARAIVHIASPSPWTRDDLIKALWDGYPRIAVGSSKSDDNAIALNPQTLEPGEAEIVLERLRELLTSKPA